MSVVADQFAIWTTAAIAQVEERRESWPDLEAFRRQLRSLSQFAEASTAVSEVAAKGWSARRILRASPLPPSDPIVELRELIAAADAFVHAYDGHSAASAMRNVLDAAFTLSCGASPLSDLAGEVLSLYGEDSDGPQLVLVVPWPFLVEPVQRWLKEEYLFAAVATPNELRNGPVRTAALLFGHPGQVFRSRYVEHDLTLQSYGWLLTAPSAPKVYVGLTSDAPPLALDEAWLFSGAEHAIPDDEMDAPEGPAATSQVSRPMVTIVRPAGIPSPHPTAEGSAIALASGHTVYFHATWEPQPCLVQRGGTGGGTKLSTVTPTSLQVGAVLLFRAGLTESEQITDRANQRLRDHHGWDAAKTAMVRAEISLTRKLLLDAIEAEDVQEVANSAARNGVTRDDIRSLVKRLHDPAFLAPVKRTAYERLAARLGLKDMVAGFQDMAVVQGAHQHATQRVRDETTQLLERSHQEWANQVDETGSARLNTRTAGELLLTQVAARDEKLVQLPSSWLGCLLDADGRPAVGIPE